jgi:hypothetical protein
MVQKLILIISIVFLCNQLLANNPPVGFLTKVKGKVLLVNVKTNKEIKAKRGAKVYIHNAVQTLKNSKAKLVFKNGTIVNIAEKTLFEIESYMAKNASGDNSSFKLFYGKIRSIVSPKQNKKMKVQTPAAVMGIRGTDFYATFDRKFKNGTTTSSVYTLSGKVAFKRIYDNDDKEVMVTPGTFSTIDAQKDGSIALPTEVKETPQIKLMELEEDMLKISREEEKMSPPKNVFISMLDKAMGREKDSATAPPEENSDQEIELKDNTYVDPTLVAKVEVKKPQVKKVVVETPKTVTKKIKPEKTPAPTPQKTVKRVALAPKRIKKKKKEKILDLYKKRFDLNTWAKFSDWMIVNDILVKKGDKTLVRVIRHMKIDDKSKKKTKLTTLDATFYDGTILNKKLIPSKNVEKLTTRVYGKSKKYKGAEIEFYVNPGSYYLSIDNGPTTKVTFEPQKDVTIKTSAFLSPGSEYYIYLKLTKALVPMRSEGNPIFVLPSSYKIAKDVKNANGVVTGQKKIKTFSIGGDALVIPEF